MKFTEKRTSQYLTFQLGNDQYAIPLLRVQGIIEQMPVTPVPGGASFVKGVFNHAGVVTPVVDLGARLGFGESAVTRRTCFILVGAACADEELPIGLMVDAVKDVLELEADEIQPPPDFGTRVRLDYLEGLIRDDDGFTLIFSVDRFLTAEELLAMKEQARAS